MGDVAAIGVMTRDLGPPGVHWSPLRARRCLFGPPDAESTRTSLQNEIRMLRKENRDRWNFDFEKGEPLSGRYQWTLVTKDVVKGGGSVAERDDVGSDDIASEDKTELKQSQITDFMRKRKLSTNQKDVTTAEPESKTRRRFST